jgi:hypothetical protein
MILDPLHAYAPDRPQLGPAGEPGTPVAELPWIDAVVGMGYFPHEVALPADWRWSRAQRHGRHAGVGGRD